MSKSSGCGPDDPAFACDPDKTAWPGMTYRQWLIGQALMGAMCNPVFNEMSKEQVGTTILEQVDTVLEGIRRE